MGGQQSSASAQSSPVGAMHSQVGNQAVQNSNVEEEMSAAGSGNTAVAGWKTVTIPGISVDQHGQAGKTGVDKRGPETIRDQGSTADKMIRDQGSAPEAGDTAVPGWQTVTIPAVSDQHGPQRTGMPDKHGPQRMPDQHGPQRMPDQHGPQRSTGGTGDAAVAGWKTVTIPGISVPDQHGPQRMPDQHGPQRIGTSSIGAGATGATGQQARDIERVKNRLLGQFESAIEDTLR